MQDLTGVPGVVDLAAMRDALVELGGDPAKVNPLVPVELVIDHSVIAEASGDRGGLRRERRHRVPAQHRALPAPALGPAGLRRLPGRAPGHGHLPPGQPRVPVPGRLRHRRRPGLLRHPGRHRLPHHHGQRARRARAGASAASRRRPPCSASRSRCCSPRWWASASPASSRPAPPPPTWSSPSPTLLRQHGVVGKFVEFFGPGRGRGPAGQPGDHRQHVPRVRGHLRHLPHRRRRRSTTSASPAGTTTMWTWSRPTPRPRACSTTPGRRPSRSTPRPSSSTSPPWSRASPARPGPRTWCALAGAGRGLPGRPSAASRRSGTAVAGRRVTAEVEDGARRGGRHHQLHQHLQPAGHGGGRPAGQAAVARGLRSEAVGEDHPGPRLAGGHGLPRPGRPHRAAGRASASTWSDSAARPASATPGPLLPGVSEAVQRATCRWPRCCRATATSRAGSIPTCGMNYLASPPLVVAYALAGTMAVDLTTDPLGTGSDGEPVMLADLWPSPEEVDRGHPDLARPRTCSAHATPRSSTATSGGRPSRRPPGPHVRLGPDLHLRAAAAVPRGTVR